MHVSSGLYCDACGFALNAHPVKNILNATQILKKMCLESYEF